MAKLRLQITVKEDLVKWMDQQIEKSRFANRSQAVEYALKKLREADTPSVGGFESTVQ